MQLIANTAAWRTPARTAAATTAVAAHAVADHSVAMGASAFAGNARQFAQTSPSIYMNKPVPGTEFGIRPRGTPL